MGNRVFSFEICKFDFFNTAIADLLRACGGGAVMGGFVLSFCGIDYLGRGMNPSAPTNTNVDFEAFVDQYLSQVNAAYTGTTDSLWAGRNSLIHTYGLSRSQSQLGITLQFSHVCPENHLRTVTIPGQPAEFWLNLPEFVGELVAATELFFRAREKNPTVLEPWYRQLLLSHDVYDSFARISVNKTHEIPYKDIHPFLVILGRRPQCSPGEISASVASALRSSLGVPDLPEGAG